MTLAATTLLASAELRVLDVRCAAPSRHVDEEDTPGFEVVFPVRGIFRRRTAAGPAVIDASVAYVNAPGGSQRIEHLSDGDRCIAATVSSTLADELAIDLAARVRPCLARSRGIDGAIVSARRGIAEETWLATLAALLHGGDGARARTGRSAVQRQRAVDAVREAVATDPGRSWSLRALSALTGYAPHHLSRLFRQSTGLTITDYRDRVRLARAAELAADGVRLADVAATLGFADHGHLTRRARQVLGVVPSRLRA